MMEKTFTVEGITFTAIRWQRPIPHWRLRLPSGEVWEPGTGGIDGSSVPKMQASLEYLRDRVGAKRFVRELGAE